LVFLLAAVSCHADLTIRYTIDVKPGVGLPPALADGAMKQLTGSIPKERVLRIKGDRTLTGVGKFTGIFDNSSSGLTLLNPLTKQYAKMSLADFVAGVNSNLPSSPAARQAMEQMKVDVETKETGQVGMVFGIRASERVLALSISANASAAPAIRMEMHTWVASADDLSRIPALREYADSAQRALSAFNPADGIQKMFSQMPGLVEKLSAVVDGLKSAPGSLTVKTQQVLYMALPGAVTNANAPLIEMDMNLAEISGDAIDPSVFEVPSDYQPVAPAEIVKAMNPPPARQAPVKPAVEARPPLGPEETVTRVGNGVSPPAVTSRVDPEYTEEARAAKVSGTVRLAVVVDKEGMARNIRVVSSLGSGLDEKAIEAVSQWRFRPGQKDGQPVNVRATIEVNFRLVDRPKQ
jgi:TonB family protein